MLTYPSSKPGSNPGSDPGSKFRYPHITKNAVVTFLTYWNEANPEEERLVNNIESLEKILNKELNEILANF